MPPVQRRSDAVTAVLMIGGALLLVYVLRLVLLPFLLAAAMAYIASPAVDWLHRRAHWPHLAAVLAAFFAYVLLGAGIGYWLASWVSTQAQQLAADATRMLQQFIAGAIGGPQARVMGQTIRAREVAEGFVRGTVSWLGSAGNAAEAASWATGMIMGVFLVFVLLFYFLLHGRRLIDGAIWLVVPRRRAEARALLARVDPMLGRYIRGVLLIVLITAALSWLAFQLVIGLPHAFGLALATGVLELVPVVGPLTAATLVGLVAVEQGSAWLVVGFVVFYVILRILIDEVLGPLILGKAATLHPVVVIFAFLAGGTLFGVLGVLLAVPFAASVKIVLTAFYEERQTLAKEAADFRP